MNSASEQHLQDTREDEHVTSPSESTTSLLGNSASATGRESSVKSALSGMNVVVTCEPRMISAAAKQYPGGPLTDALVSSLACCSLIGQAVCFELAKQGANLALTDPSKGAGQELCRELYKSGHTGSLLFAAIDLRDLERLSSYIKNVSKTLKKIDGLVNCATFSPEVSPR